MGDKISLALLILLGAALALTTDQVAPGSATAFDSQNGMGFGQLNVIYDATQYVNASDNVYAITAGKADRPTWAQANWSSPYPSDSKAVYTLLAIEHQQDAANQITVNVSVNNGTGWAWNVCSIAPLNVGGVDAVSYCNLTGYVSANVSLLQIYLNITYSSGTKRESIDSLFLNRTYIRPANLTGNVSVSSPADGTILDANQAFGMVGAYNVSCRGGAGTECGPTEVYAEFCPGFNCTDFKRISGDTYVSNATQNRASCGYMYAGSDCSGTLNVSLNATAGKYMLRITADSYSNDVYSPTRNVTAYAVVVTDWTPPYSSVCYDPVGGHGVYDCTSYVNVSDLNYAEVRYNPDNQPGWSNANFSFKLQSGVLIENVSMLVSHYEDNTPFQNGTAYYWNGTAWKPACALTMAAVPHSDVCSLPLSYFNGADTLRNAMLRFEFNTSSGTSTFYPDFLGMRVQYRVPFSANLTGSAYLYEPIDRSVIPPNTDFNITGSYSLNCVSQPGVECLVTTVFAEFCYGEGCANFSRIGANTNVYSTSNGAGCGFMIAGDNCSGNFSALAQANAGKYVFRLRGSDYAGDVYSNSNTVTFPGTVYTPCTALYSAVCNSPSANGTNVCTAAVNATDGNYFTLQYAPSNQPAWMNADLSFSLARNAYVVNVSSSITSYVDDSSKQSGSGFTWNVTGWQKVCDLAVMQSPHTDTCALPLGLFRMASNLDNVLNRFEYYASSGTRRAYIDSTCANVLYRTPLLYVDKSEYFVGGQVNITGNYWVYNGLLNLSIYDSSGNLMRTAIAPTNGSGYFNYLWPIDNVTIKKDIDFFVINATDIVEPWHNDSMPFGVRGCEAYVAEQYEPCSVQCPVYTNYTVSITTYEGDETIVSRFKVCHIA